MTQPLLSIIIPTFRDWDRCLECLHAIEKQTVDDHDIEVIVVNNDPADPLPRTARVARNVRIIEEKAPGSYAARNAGVAESTGSLLAFTDSDCQPSPGWLEGGIAALRANGGNVRVTGPIRIFRPAGCEELAYLYERKFAFDQFNDRRFKYAFTANLIVSRSTFERVGPFAAQMMSGGDTEWNDRAEAMGVPLVFDEAAAILHPSRKSFNELAIKYRRIAGGTVARGGLGTRELVLSRLKPPINKIRAVDRSDMNVREVARLFFLVWRLRFVSMSEFLLVRYGLKTHERR